jgi:poly(3-hydroxyalkanoate) depolymerase
MAKTGNPVFEMKTVEGRTVRVARWSARAAPKAARPLLFFNGIGANIELIAPFAERLATRDVVTFDMPGVGESPDPTLPYWPWMMARVADRIMDDYGYGQIDVMGVSWGGAMAQQFALQYRSRVEKLILAATSAGMLMVPGKLSALSKMADPRRYVDPDFMTKHFKTLYGGSTAGSGGHVLRIKPPSKIGYFNQVFAMLGWTSAPFLPFLSAKTLIMMGDEDAIVPLVNGKILKALIPDAELAVIKGGGHLFLVAQADETTQLIEAFLNEQVQAKKAA